MLILTLRSFTPSASLALPTEFPNINAPPGIERFNCLTRFPVKFICSILAVLAASTAVHSSRADEHFLKPNDVIALVGGEDTVVAGELGYLEFLLQRSLPGHRLKVRNLAWEGDTVFEQPRMLNYPKLEQQLDEIGATVVVAQFGQMEGFLLDDNFHPSLGKTLDRTGQKHGDEGRRLALIFPAEFEGAAAVFNDRLHRIHGAIATEAQGRRCFGINLARPFLEQKLAGYTRDGIHLNETGHAMAARLLSAMLQSYRAGIEDPFPKLAGTQPTLVQSKSEQQLLDLIRTKNRLWDRYRRPQNWAFLAGDRITQPSSRDHRDPSKRWFPEEMKEFIPLIEAKEREIWTLAARLSTEKN